MDAVFAPADAIDKKVLKTLCARSDAKGGLRLAGHLAALAVTGALIAGAGASPWLAPALLVHGIVLVFLDPLLGIHLSRRLGEWLLSRPPSAQLGLSIAIAAAAGAVWWRTAPVPGRVRETWKNA